MPRLRSQGSLGTFCSRKTCTKKKAAQGSLEYIIIIGGIIILAAATYFMLRGFTQSTGAGTSESIYIAGDTLRLELENMGRSETRFLAENWGSYAYASRLTVNNTGGSTTTLLTLFNLTDYGLNLSELEIAYNDSGEIEFIEYSVEDSNVAFTTPTLPSGTSEILIFHNNSSALELDNLNYTSSDEDVNITDGTSPEEMPDTTPPSIIIFSEAYGDPGSVEDADIKVMVYDGGSAIAEVYYSIDNSPYFLADNLYYGYQGMTLEGHPEDLTYNSGTETIHIIVTVPSESNYTIRVWAVDSHGNEKVETRSVSIIVSPGAESEPPVISDPDTVNNTVVDVSVFALNLTTNEPAICKYATSPAIPYDDMTFFSETGSTFHQENITLMDGVNYDYFFKCEDIADNLNQADYLLNFTKSGTDSTPPAITETEPANNSLVEATFLAVNLTTNEMAECRFAAAGGQAYNVMAEMDTTGYTFHQHTFMLVNGQNYKYYFKCNDSNGNANLTDYVLNFTKAYVEGAVITFSGPLNMNGSGIYNVSEIIANIVNISELTIHNIPEDKALYVRHDMTNALIESIGGSPLKIISALHLILEAAGDIILNPSGNVGIGTESPGTKLDVNGTVTAAGFGDGSASISGGDITNLGSLNSNVYYCSNLAEINSALASIGSGGGTIVIESGTISVTSTIEISGGGSYRITGQGSDSVLQPSGDHRCFNITSAASLVIENLKINSTNVLGDTEAIQVTEGSNNRVLIRNVGIVGDDTGNGWGININSEKVVVEYCYFDGLRLAVQIDGANSDILYNKITNTKTPDAAAGISATNCYAISSDADDVKVIGNTIRGVTGGNGGAGSSGAGGAGGAATGVKLYGSRNIAKENHISLITGGNAGAGDSGDGGRAGFTYGIDCNRNHAIVEGNIVKTLKGGNAGNADGAGSNGGAGGRARGIRIYTGSDKSIVNGNTLIDMTGTNGGDVDPVDGVNDNGGNGAGACGIEVQGQYVTVSGNFVENLSVGDGGTGGATGGTGGASGRAAGIYLTKGNHTSVTGNVVYNTQPAAPGAGNTDGFPNPAACIELANSNKNAVSGNTCAGTTVNQGTKHIGIRIREDSDNNAITGNNCCDYVNTGSAIGYGIRVETAGCDENLIYGNLALGNDVDLSDLGTGTFGDATTNNVG